MENAMVQNRDGKLYMLSDLVHSYAVQIERHFDNCDLGSANATVTFSKESEAESYIAKRYENGSLTDSDFAIIYALDAEGSIITCEYRYLDSTRDRFISAGMQYDVVE